MSGLQITYKVKEAGEKIREGEFSKGGKAGLAAVGALGAALFFLSVSRYLNALIDSMKEGNQDEVPLTKDKPIDEHFTDLKNFYLKNSVQHALGTVPLASEMQYAIESYSKNKAVKFPFNSVLDNTAASVQGILMMLDIVEGDAATKYKNMAYATGYLTGAPTPAAYKALKALSEVELPPVLESGEWKMLYNRVNEFLDNNRDNKTMDPQLIKDLENLKMELDQTNPDDQNYIQDLENLKLDESGGTPEEKVKNSALNVIREGEGLRLGVWTIGYGTTAGVKEGNIITVEDAEKRLVEYYDKMVKEIDPLIKRDLTANQRVAIYSFAYNVGSDKFKDSTMLEKLNDPKYTDEEIAREFRKWIYDDGEVVEGLKNRRAKEESLFLAVDKNNEIPKG
jgi:lysozyme